MTIDGVDDAKKFHKLKEALDVIQICKEDQERAFEILTAILWPGNISFQDNDVENCIEVVNMEAASNAASLMGCSSQELITVLSTHKIKVGQLLQTTL